MWFRNGWETRKFYNGCNTCRKQKMSVKRKATARTVALLWYFWHLSIQERHSQKLLIFGSGHNCNCKLVACRFETKSDAMQAYGLCGTDRNFEGYPLNTSNFRKLSNAVCALACLYLEDHCRSKESGFDIGINFQFINFQRCMKI